MIKEGIPAKARRKGGHQLKGCSKPFELPSTMNCQHLKIQLNRQIELVKVNGRISVITFHSLEDRLCKQIFQEYEKGPEVPRGLPIIPEEYTPK